MCHAAEVVGDLMRRRRRRFELRRAGGTGRVGRAGIPVRAFTHQRGSSGGGGSSRERGPTDCLGGIVTWREAWEKRGVEVRMRRASGSRRAGKVVVGFAGLGWHLWAIRQSAWCQLGKGANTKRLVWRLFQASDTRQIRH